MADPRDIGRAHIRVRIYNKIPGVVQDTEALRRSQMLAISFGGDRQGDQKKWGIQYIAQHTEDQSSHVTGAIIPQVCYEPVNNWMMTDRKGLAVDTDVFWKPLAWAHVDYVFKQLVQDLDNFDSEDLQKWKSEPLSVSRLEYYEEEYRSTAWGQYYPEEEDTAATEEDATVTDEEENPVDVSVSYYVHQYESAKNVWWGIKPEYAVKPGPPYTLAGSPFWVSIKPSATHLTKQGARALLMVVFAKGAHSSGGARSFAFVLDPNGYVAIHYMTFNESGEINIRCVPVDLPEISDAFRNQQEIRVGFMMIAGRICVYLDNERYQLVSIYTDEGDEFNPRFNLYTVQPEIYGYGCSAHVSLFPMTFYKRAWFVIQEMDGDVEYKGYTFPRIASATTVTPTVGGMVDGYMISDPTTEDKFHSAGDRPKYSALFSYYKEVDLVKGTESAELLGNQVPAYGMLNMWGTIHVVRSDPIKRINGMKRFWVCYLETGDVDGRTVTNPADGVSRSVTTEQVGFPQVFAFRAVREMSKVPTGITASDGYTDITDDILTFHVTRSLDEMRPSFIDQKATVEIYDQDDNYSYLLTKARGIKIWAKWSKNGSVSFDDGDLLFSGIAYGKSAALVPGRNTTSLVCYDNLHVLDRIKIKNSPFYDGMEVFSVVEDIAERGGIDSTDDVDHSRVLWTYLGSGFTFDKPSYRFNREMTLKECLKESIRNHPYMLYVDGDGTLHMTVVPGGFDWTKVSMPGYDGTVYTTYYLDLDATTNPFRIVLNQIQMDSGLDNNVFNSFRLMTVNRTDNTPIVVQDGIPSSITSPSSIGYLGHVAEINRNIPALGSAAEARAYLQFLKSMYSKPVFQTAITTIGHKPPFRPGQFINVRGNLVSADYGRFRATSIDHKFNAEQNDWTTIIEVAQYNPGRLTRDASSSSSAAALP